MTQRALRAARVRGFYAIVDAPNPERIAELAARACAVQVRMKTADARSITACAELVRRITAAAGVLCIVNDRLDIALAVGADGVHLGQDDLSLAHARRLADAAGATDLLIGISTHTEAQVRAATSGRADYLGFGPIFSTTTKANPDPVVGLDGLRAAVAAAQGLPIVAIGGITPARLPDIYAAGAAAACMISAA